MKREAELEKFLMATRPERSNPLHNFTLPFGLRWGNQKSLKCMKVDPNGEFYAVDRRSSDSDLNGRWMSSESEKRRRLNVRRESSRASPSPEIGGPSRKSKLESYGDDGIEAVRTKLMFDFQTAADKMKDAILRDGIEEAPSAAVVPALPPSESETAKPWNLRTRRAACKAPGGASGGRGSSLNVDVSIPNFASSLRSENKSPGLGGAGAGVSGNKRERPKFSIPLSQREISEDFMAITGHRPNRRPKKRPKNVRKQLDMLFPGLWLSEITVDDYKVPDDPDNAKR